MLLVVDDDRDMLRILRRLLERRGYHVRTYDQAESALNDLLSGAIIPETIILDMCMPEMSGCTFLRYLDDYSLAPGVPVILSSGARDWECQHEPRNPRPRLMLPKPYGMDDLYAILDRLVMAVA